MGIFPTQRACRDATDQRARIESMRFRYRIVNDSTLRAGLPPPRHRLESLERLVRLTQAADLPLQLLAARFDARAIGRLGGEARLEVGDVGGAQLEELTHLGEIPRGGRLLGVVTAEHFLRLEQQRGLILLQSAMLG